MSPEDVARRLRAELDAVPVPERPWVAVRPALARRRARHRVMEAVAAAAAVVLIAGFGVAAARVFGASPAPGHGEGYGYGQLPPAGYADRSSGHRGNQEPAVLH